MPLCRVWFRAGYLDAGFLPGRIELGQAEVKDLGRALGCDRDVCGLQVTVNYSPGVRGGQAGRDLTNEANDVVGRHGPSRETILQRLAVTERHGDEESVPPFADFVNRRDVRVVERAGGLGFSNKAQLRRRVSRRPGREKLQGNIALQRFVTSAIDYAHGARPDQSDQAIVRDVLTDE